MGVAIGEIIEKEEIGLELLEGKRVGIDSFNILYQFLSSIRSREGEPLMDGEGRITSHLTGLLYRTSNLINRGIKPVFVFDGEPSKLKEETRKERRKIRTEAKDKYDKAKKEGKKEEMRKYAQQTSSLDEEMIKESKELVKFMGLPIIEAPSEGEAQIAFMAEKGELYGTVSQDYDALLFGSPILLRNITVTGKRKLPGKDIYIEVKPEQIKLKSFLEKLGINREKLVWMGVLVGTDFNKKFPGIGPKTALKLVKEHGSFEEIIKETKFKPDFDYREVERIFMKPACSEEYSIKFSEPQREKIIELLVERHDFNKERVQNVIKKLEETAEEKGSQTSIEKWI